MADRGQTRAWVRDVVRSGLLDPEREHAEIREVLGADHPDLDAEATARDWIAGARREWAAEAAGWPRPTDYERLQAVFAELSGRGLLVLQGCADHWAARDALAEATDRRGVVWFTAPDVWHAIDEGMLEVNLWHADTANAAPGDRLLEEVIAAFAEAGLSAAFDEGRIEVAAHWRRPPG